MEALIIEDEIDVCYLLSTILKNKQIQPSYVNTLADAKSFLKTHHPEIIFLDNHLPDGTGVDFINKIKKVSPQSKIILITAYDTVADRTKAQTEGADYFIAKPFTRDTIYNTVKMFTL